MWAIDVCSRLSTHCKVLCTEAHLPLYSFPTKTSLDRQPPKSQPQQMFENTKRLIDCNLDQYGFQMNEYLIRTSVVNFSNVR